MGSAYLDVKTVAGDSGQAKPCGQLQEIGQFVLVEVTVLQLEAAFGDAQL